MHSTLVVRKNSKTVSVAARPTDASPRGCVCLYSHALPISLHTFLACRVHTRHRVKMWCRDWGSPLAYHKHSLMSVFLTRRR